MESGDFTKFLKGSWTNKVKDPLKVDNYIDDIKNNERRIHSNCALIVLCVLAATAAIVMGVLGYQYGAADNSAVVVRLSTVLPSSPNAILLDSASVPLSMTLPNDLSHLVGLRFRVWSITAQPHTIRIATGAYTSTWDGSNKLATFGGAIGDGLVFEVIARDRIVAEPVRNVVFS